MTKENEIVAAARDAKATVNAAEKNNSWQLAVGVGIGIGSAALAAALLYTRRQGGRKDDE